MASTYQTKWARCLDKIRDNIGVEKFDIWFSHVKAVDYSEESGRKFIHLQVPSMFYYEILEGRTTLPSIGKSFCNLLRATLLSEFGAGISIRYKIEVVADDKASEVQVDAEQQSKAITNRVAKSVPTRDPRTGNVDYEDFDSFLNEIYTFDNYCTGQSNKLPFTIARFIADNPQKTEFNPFFLFGSVGVGKTHLIQAVGLRIKETCPKKRVLYTTMRNFQHLYQVATMEKRVPDFINWYQSIDVLLIDDIQELSYKQGTNDVLFTILHHLMMHNRKIILTSDRAPKDLEGITDRLIDRFKWGVVEELPKPDKELRTQILRHKSRHSGLDLSESIIDLIASNVTGSVRELEGVVMGIYGRAINLNEPITEDLVMEVMSHSVKLSQTAAINFDMIVESTAEAYNLQPDVLFSKSRVRDIVDARQVIMYLARKHTSLSTPAIGMRLNRRYTTVLHGVKTVEDRLPLEKELARKVASIEESLKA